MMDNLKPEEKAEIILYGWLSNYGKVYFNRKNYLNVETFRVEGKSTEIPDLLLITELFGKEEVIAIEVKDGDAGNNIRQADKIFKKYLLNYYEKKTRYFINDKELKIDRFLVATQYSPTGHLFGYGDSIQTNGCAIRNDWQNKTVPKLEFVRTKDFGRTIIHNYSDWRSKDKIKNSPAIGWIISDVVFKFTEEELKVQSGMTGFPLIQGVSWNSKLNRWGQFLIKL
ncbi:MAG: hypothetical protein WCR04_11245 [Fibrobacteraceae bacterium]